VPLYFNPAQIYVFDAEGMLLPCSICGAGHEASRIELGWPHAYKQPQARRYYALVPLKMAFEDGGAYALLVAGCDKTARWYHVRIGHAALRRIDFDKQKM
jgi:hypothetical protein